ncbi:hypothetical protein GOV10_03595, partial [Candidatus Woesearchaeota archaeon]|nr:hypothetical protein [Candidatus Woesearchaeota archaeon]
NYETVRVLEKHKKNYVYVSVDNEHKYYSVHDMPLLSFDAQTLFSSLEVGKEYCVATRGLSTILLGKNITSVSEGACQGLEEKFTLNKALKHR